MMNRSFVLATIDCTVCATHVKVAILDGDHLELYVCIGDFNLVRSESTLCNDGAVGHQ